MPEVATFAAVVRTANGAYQFAKKQGWVDRAKFGVRRKHQVLVLGTTGVGKTNFLHSLTNPNPEAISAESRTAFSKQHDLLVDRFAFKFIDTPGEQGLRTERTKAISSALQDGGIAGAIHVVSWGYHEFKTRERPALDANGQVPDEYLERHRGLELTAMSEWAPLMAASSPWLITLVTKADLWWDRQDEVTEHYTSGEYGAVVAENFSTSTAVLDYCSVFHKFYGTTAMSGGFDDRDRAEKRSHVYGELVTAVESRPAPRRTFYELL